VDPRRRSRPPMTHRRASRGRRHRHRAGFRLVALRVRSSTANQEVRNAQQVCGQPNQVGATTCVKVVLKKGAINHPDPEQKASHRLAGTAIDVLGGPRACDPKRLAIYFTKHSSPNTLSSKEYQHIVPKLWRPPDSSTCAGAAITANRIDRHRHPTSRPASVNGS
jgi:hypothetical protein